jgi:hypothetical protein
MVTYHTVGIVGRRLLRRRIAERSAASDLTTHHKIEVRGDHLARTPYHSGGWRGRGGFHPRDFVPFLLPA